MDTALEKMQRHGQRCQPKLFVKTELFKAEEIVADILGEITTHELLAAVVEEFGIVATGVGKRRTLMCLLAAIIGLWCDKRDVPIGPPDGFSYARTWS